MKKRHFLVLGCVVALLPSLCFAAAFERNLYYGIQGDADVEKLQEFLTDEALYSGPVTGNFFSLTLQAVKKYQAREGISPAAGYFGPLTREKANAALATQIGASEEQAVLETGAPTVPIVSPAQQQIDVLLQQIAILQAQLANQAQLQQTIQEQNQMLGQIQANTTPEPQPSAPDVKKELSVSVNGCNANQNGIYCAVQASYQEDGVEKPGILVTISSDDQGTFNSEGKANTNVQVTHWVNHIAGTRALAIFEYIPSATSSRMLTVTANGLTATTASPGQVDKNAMEWNAALGRWD